MINKKSVLFMIYCLILIWIVLFKLSFSLDDILALRCKTSVNLIPFHYDVETSSHFEEVWLNVLIFVPFGLFSQMLNLGYRQSLLTGFSFSLVMEFCQYILKIGATDITDIITNTLGTIVGVVLYIFFIRIIKSQKKVDKILIILSSVCLLIFSVLIILLMIAN